MSCSFDIAVLQKVSPGQAVKLCRRASQPRKHGSLYLVLDCLLSDYGSYKALDITRVNARCSLSQSFELATHFFCPVEGLLPTLRGFGLSKSGSVVLFQMARALCQPDYTEVVMTAVHLAV